MMTVQRTKSITGATILSFFSVSFFGLTQLNELIIAYLITETINLQYLVELIDSLENRCSS